MGTYNAFPITYDDDAVTEVHLRLYHDYGLRPGEDHQTALAQYFTERVTDGAPIILPNLGFAYRVNDSVGNGFEFPASVPTIGVNNPVIENIATDTYAFSFFNNQAGHLEGVTLRGPNATNAIFNPGTGPGTLLEKTLKSVVFDTGNTNPASQVSCILIQGGTFGITIEGCTFRNAFHGIVNATGFDLLSIRRNTFTGLWGAAIKLTQTAGISARKLWIEDNDIKNPVAGNAARGNPITLHGSAGNGFDEVVIRRNTIAGVAGQFFRAGDPASNAALPDMISVHNVRDFVIDGNIMVDGGEAGIAIAYGAKRGIVRGNIGRRIANSFLAIDANTVPATLSGDIEVSDNECTDNSIDDTGDHGPQPLADITGVRITVDNLRHHATSAADTTMALLRIRDDTTKTGGPVKVRVGRLSSSDGVPDFHTAGTGVTNSHHLIRNVRHDSGMMRHEEITANRDLREFDCGRVLRSAAATDLTLTIPADFDDGFFVLGEAEGAGNLVITAASGIFLNGTDGGTATFSGQFTLRRVSANQYRAG